MDRSEAQQPAYLDSSLPIRQRVDDLLGRMTLEEKFSQLVSSSPAIERLGLPAYRWGGECLHGLVHTGKATVFPGSLNLAATFDEDLVKTIADAISSEARAKYQDPNWRSDGEHRTSLSFWTPNINLFRDPRWGRGQETYGEDPLLTGRMGAAFVRGLQGDDPKYLKTSACAKHYAVHSGPEEIRRAFDARVSARDLHESYLPAFKKLVDAGVACVMGAYNRVNGEPCCGSRTLLEEILRDRWGYEGFVVSDAGAVPAFDEEHKVTDSPEASAALAINTGCDMEIGGKSYQKLPEAVEKGLVEPETIDRALKRILTVRFRLGLFDPPEAVPYTSIGPEVIQSQSHVDLARQAAEKSVVLLKNNGLLPLQASQKTVFVTGPTAADLQVLLGNFYRGISGTLTSMVEGLVQAAPEGTCITHMQGCYLQHENVFPSTWAYGLGKWADAIIACLGLSPLMEGEDGECIGAVKGGDKVDLSLPANQLRYLRGLAKLGKPLIVVCTGGSPMDLREVHELADAVLFVGYPGQCGGRALGDAVFGRFSPSGKLPVTFPKSIDDVPAYESYDLTGRTYRYLETEPMYPFGFGLGYGTIRLGELSCSSQAIEAGESLVVALEATNDSDEPVEEVIQLYLTDLDASAPAARWALKDFRRVRLEPGLPKRIAFTVTAEMMQRIDSQGQARLEPGRFRLHLGTCCPGPRSAQLGAPEPLKATFTLR